jgi:ketosteroid isomerase-like protein
MRNGVLTAAAVSLLLLAPAVARAQVDPVPGKESIEAAIRAVMEQMRHAAAERDAVALFEHVLDSATPPIIEDGRVTASRAVGLEGTAREFQAFTSLNYAYAREDISILSPTTVLWVGAGTASAILQDGRHIEVPFAETVVFLKHEGRWKVLHAHRSTPGRRGP